MALVDHGHADLSGLRERLDAWMQGQAGYAGSKVVELQQASTVSGFSNQTYRVTVVGPGGGTGKEELILRLPPARTGLFPEYDMGRQYAFMAGLRDEPGVAMARCRWLEESARPLGLPFYIMDHVPGEVAPDQPKYVCEGWVVDATAQQRRRLWDSSVDQLVHLARVRWHGEKLASLDWVDRQKPRLQQHLELWERWALWGGRLLPRTEDPLMKDLAHWLHMHLPAREVAGVVWGDSRFGNIIYRDFQPVALLDWELAVIGDPMLDLAYMLFHVFLTELYHADPAAQSPRLAGFGADAHTVARYCEATQRTPQDYRYFWLFNAFKMLCIWQCKASLMVRSGAWTVDQALEARRGERLRPWIAKVLESGSEGAYLR